jgi:ABC-type transporter Mla MlaB component
VQLAYGNADMAPLGDGDHVCWVVDDPASYAAAAGPLIAEGRTRGQHVVVFAPEGRAVPMAAGPPAGSVAAADPYAAFFGQGPLDPAIMLRALRKLSARAREGGYDGLRVISDMDWLLPGSPSPEEIAGLEIIVDRAARELGATIVCAYRRSSFDPVALLGALPVHPIRWGHDAGPQFDFHADGTSGWLLSGEIDVAVIGTFAAAFAAAASLGDCLVDVSGLEFVDVAGLRAMSQAARQAQADVQLRGAPAALHRLWQLLGPAGPAPELHLA